MLDDTSVTRAMVTQDNPSVLEVLYGISALSKRDAKAGRRWIHPFPAKMPASVPQSAISHLVHETGVVLDPFAGSGTTLYAAQIEGRRSIGVDMDPLSILVSRVVTTPYRSEQLRELIDALIKNARRIAARRTKNPFPRHISDEDAEFIRFWFPDESIRQLSALAKAIVAIEDENLRNFAWVVFSTLIISKEQGASRAMDIPRSRPHIVEDKPIALPFDYLERRFKECTSRLPLIDVEKDVPHTTVHAGDARALPVEDSTVDLVFTSPPYSTAIDYMRGHKFSLVWMGHNLSTLRHIRGTMIGSFRGMYDRDGLPTELEEMICARKIGEEEKAQDRRYLSDLKRSISEMGRVLKRDGIAIIVLGPKILSKSKNDASRVASMVSEAAGLSVIGSTTRRIMASRRSLPFYSKKNGNPLSHRMREEVLLAVRKTGGRETDCPQGKTTS